MFVFVLDKNKKPLDPCPTKTAWKLLKRGRAAVFKKYPFTIIMKDRTLEESVVHDHRVKIDPGSKATGIAVVTEETGKVVLGMNLEHRGWFIKKAMDSRRTSRRSRRFRKTRYRKPRFDHRTRKEGWLPPSLESRVDNIMTWVGRLQRSCPVVAISLELVKFDTQKLDNPEISGVEYQQGTLSGYEVREYLLEKWGRKCAYCGKTDIPLQVEHILARANGGTDRISNLTLACESCNQKKGSQLIEDFLKSKSKLLVKIQKQAKAPLQDAAVMNSTRWELWRRLIFFRLPVECGTGGRTKFNRIKMNLPKDHWIDAACVGASTTENLNLVGICPLVVKAMGHGRRQRCRTDKYGFPVQHAKKGKYFMGYMTGDIVRAVIPCGKYQGVHEGRVSIRHTKTFTLNGFSVNPIHLIMVQNGDGYNYSSDCKDKTGV